MSNNQQFDNAIKEQFNDYSAPVHPRIWDNIVSKREKKRPVGFWFTFFKGRNILLLTGLLIAAGSGAYLLLKKSTVKQENIIALNAKQNLPADEEKFASRNNNALPEITANTTNETTEASVANTAIDANDKTTGNSEIISAATLSKIKNYSPFTQAGQNGKPVNYTSKKKNILATNNDYDIADANLTFDNLDLQNNFLIKLLFVAPKKITLEKNTAALNKRGLPNIYLPDCPSIEKNAAGNKTYFEVYAGPDIAFRTLSDTGNSAYLQKRKESTKFSSAYSAGIRYTKVFNNGMSLRTGLNYSQINEKFTFIQGNLVQVTYIINTAGDTTGSYITTGTRYKTTYNKFKTVDVPLLIGYEFGNGKIHANVNAGTIVNIYSWQKGDVLDTSYNPVSITTGKTNSPYQFKTNIGLGFMAAVSVYYKINEKVHVLAEPYFRYNLTPMSKEKLTLKEKYNTTGLRLGLRVDLH
jgi:hypothetical protein